MVRRPSSGRSGRFRGFACTLAVLCVLAVTALIFRFSTYPAQTPDRDAREDPTAGKRRPQYQPHEASAASSGGRRGAGQSAGGRAGKKVVDELVGVESGRSTGKPGDAIQAGAVAGGGDAGWDQEEVQVTRRKIPIPDDADLRAGTARGTGHDSGGGGLQEDSASGNADSDAMDTAAQAEGPTGTDNEEDENENDGADAGGGDSDGVIDEAGDEDGADEGGTAEGTADGDGDVDLPSGGVDAEGPAGGIAQPVDIHAVDFHDHAVEHTHEAWVGDAGAAGAGSDADDTADSGDDADNGNNADVGAGNGGGDADEDDDDDDDEGDDGDEGDDAEAGAGEEEEDDYDEASTADDNGDDSDAPAAGPADAEARPRRVAFENPPELGALGYADMDWCPGAPEPAADAVTAVDARLKMLVVTGARDGGTDLLQAVLSGHPGAVVGTPRNTHPRVVGTDDPRANDLNFFNSWPAGDSQSLIDMWPHEGVAQVASEEGPAQFLLDVSPEYLMNAVVPPRLRQQVPQAKVIIVLQPPAETAYFAWSALADRGAWCGEREPDEPCVLPTFEATVNQYIHQFDPPSCDFTKSAVEYGLPMTWGRCNRCAFSFFDHHACMRLPALNQEIFPCIRRQLNVLDACVWGAQLSWWLHFYPPEQLFVTTTAALTSPDTRMEVLQSILDFAEVPGDAALDADAVGAAASAAIATTTTTLESMEPEDVERAEAYFKPQMHDLQALLQTYFPDTDFPGLFQ